jgi:PUA domain protein
MLGFKYMRKTLSKSEVWDLNSSLKEKYGIDVLDKKDIIFNVDNKILLVNGEPDFFMHDKQWVPTLKLMIKKPFMKVVVVDMGAIKFVVSGADIMKPGIVAFDDKIKKDDYVMIVDVTNKKPIAIGQAMFNAEQIQKFPSGRVIKTLHYVGDEIWKSE